jgi:hypothetical protein
MSDAFQLFAGLPRPLSPGGGALAYYDPAADRLTVADLARGTVRPLPPGTRAGCWLGDRHFLAATDKELLLVSIDTGRSKRLIRGRWLPLWADERTRQVLACAATSDRWTFDLVRLRLLSD